MSQQYKHIYITEARNTRHEQDKCTKTPNKQDRRSLMLHSWLATSRSLSLNVFYFLPTHQLTRYNLLFLWKGDLETLSFCKKNMLICELYRRNVLSFGQSYARLACIATCELLTKLSRKDSQQCISRNVELRCWIRSEELLKHVQTWPLSFHSFGSRSQPM